MTEPVVPCHRCDEPAVYRCGRPGEEGRWGACVLCVSELMQEAPMTASASATGGTVPVHVEWITEPDVVAASAWWRQVAALLRPRLREIAAELGVALPNAQQQSVMATSSALRESERFTLPPKRLWPPHPPRSDELARSAVRVVDTALRWDRMSERERLLVQARIGEWFAIAEACAAG